MTGWRVADIPDQSGRTFLVTGATDGLGFHTALDLAGKGARVILAARNPARGETALARIRQAHPLADITFQQVEMGELASVRALADRVGATPLDGLVNNAGVRLDGPRQASADGFERHLAVNYLGHFTLTGLLLDALRQGSRPRVVSLSSLMHRMASLHFDDLQLERSYSPSAAYGQSKLAMLMFARELQRRSDAHGWGLTSLAVHPGGSQTKMLSPPAGPDGRATLIGRLAVGLIKPLTQTAAQGALPSLYAAAAPQAERGAYYGPSGFMEIKGPPRPAKVSDAAADPAAGERLWNMSQALTGHPFGAAA
jgi:NAD(P)-dependent dehydrogenase (short-subunit alcohol dehydrogenase family)